jgi:hypothetical protein
MKSILVTDTPKSCSEIEDRLNYSDDSNLKDILNTHIKIIFVSFDLGV